MKYEETKRCRNIRRALICMYVVCAYMLSTTFAYAYIEVDGKEELISMTGLNLAFGSMGADHPVYRNLWFGLMYMIIPLIGFLFTFFDHRSNRKNYVSIACGILGCSSVALPIGFNSQLAPGIGSIVSMLLYLLITPMSAISIFMKLEDNKKIAQTPTAETSPRLNKHR